MDDNQAVIVGIGIVCSTVITVASIWSYACTIGSGCLW